MEKLIKDMKEQHEYFLDTVQEYENKIKVLDETIASKDHIIMALKEELVRVYDAKRATLKYAQGSM